MFRLKLNNPIEGPLLTSMNDIWEVFYLVKDAREHEILLMC